MDEQATTPVPAVAPPKAKFSPLRILLIGVLVVLVGVLFFEYRARFQAAAADERLQEHVVSEEEDTGLTDMALLSADLVRQIIGREPAETSTLNGQQVEMYAWRGPLRTYTVHVLYSAGSKPILAQTYVNQDPESAGD